MMCVGRGAGADEGVSVSKAVLVIQRRPNAANESSNAAVLGAACTSVSHAVRRKWRPH